MATIQVTLWDSSSAPALYRCADAASSKAQRLYLSLVGVNISLVVFGAFAGSFGPSDLANKRVFLVIAAVTFVLGLGTSGFLAFKHWERTWYSGRAVAESTKSLMWKFVTGAEPFPIDLPEADVLARFGASLRELLREHVDLSGSLGGDGATGEQVTQWMVGVRTCAVGVRRDAYLSQRVNEQKEWYARNAGYCKKRQGQWFVGFILAQLAAAGSAVLTAIHLDWTWQPSGVFAAIAAAVLAWGQVRRYQDLAQAYGYAAQELGLIAIRGRLLTTREDLAHFVSDAETAISREHTSWVARREVE